jgi:protein-S-isoprenylcysteine O-methyltransferase Ste14
MAAVLGVILVYAGGYWRYRRSPLRVFGEHCRPRLARLFAGSAWRTIGIALTLAPFIWFVGGLLPGLPVQVVEKLADHVPSLHTQVPALHTFTSKAWPWVNDRLWVMYLGIGLVCLAFWWRKGRSPALAFWNALAWRPQFYSRFPSFARNLTIWCLHLLIAAAFGATLLRFLQGNLEAMVATGWSTSHFVFVGSLKSLHLASLLAWAKSCAALLLYITTHAPHPASVGDAFETIKSGLWALTVVGCIVGYAHSVLSPLWGKRIRNLDFTALGWITNALCYPLLGMAAWRLVPSVSGSDPILTAGPLFHIVQWLALACNLFYTLSIWNLGTMFGVMTDKGVRATGYYATVRHPSYTLEVCMFILLGLAGFTGFAQWVGIAMFPILYWLRSEREDVFMARSNPDYLTYRSATPYKFVPGFY